MKPKRIVFYGLFGQTNLGNDCSLQAMMYHTRKFLPGSEFKCICTGPEEISAKYGIPTFEMYAPFSKARKGNLKNPLRIAQKITIRLWRELHHAVGGCRTLKGYDLFIVPGTGLLVDHTTGPYGFPYYLFKWAIMAKVARCKMLVVSVGAGPINHPLSKLFIKIALWLASYRSYRDCFSKKYLERMGFDSKADPVYPDLAFSLPETMMRGCKCSDERRPVIGVGVVDYSGRAKRVSHKGEGNYQDYIRKTANFVRWLLEHSYSVRVLIGDIKYDSSVRGDLVALIEKEKLQGVNEQIINEPVISVEELISALIKTKIVVSPRYHNLILALMLNKPVISLSHDEKFVSLMNALGLPEYCLAIENLDVDMLIKKFMELETKGEELQPHIREKTEEYRIALDEQYKYIFTHFCGE